MPQKKNPDAAELLRAKAPRVVGHYAALQGVLHALPLTYNKDLQEDKEHLFDTADTLELALAAARGMVARRALLARADGRRGRRRAARRHRRRRHGWCATECPSARPTGSSLGSCARAEDAGRSLSELSPAELAAHSPVLAEHAEEYRELLTQSSWLESKVSEGGTASERVREQLQLARGVLAHPRRGVPNPWD